MGFALNQPRASSASLKRNGVWSEFLADLADCKSPVVLHRLHLVWRRRADAEAWPSAWVDALEDEIERARAALTAEFPITG